MDMSTITQRPTLFDSSLNSVVDLYKQEQRNLINCRERIVQFVDELKEKDATILEYKTSTETSKRYINRLENINIRFKDDLVEEKTNTKKLEKENRELKLELERLKIKAV